jgi:hypothetical protein
MSRKVVAPLLRIWAMVGAKSAARSVARLRLAAAPVFCVVRLMTTRCPSLFRVRVPPGAFLSRLQARL